MALDKNALAAAFVDLFKKAYDEDWSQQQVADGLAAAIDTYVRGGVVAGLKTKLTLDVPNNTGTGIQTGTVNLQ